MTRTAGCGFVVTVAGSFLTDAAVLRCGGGC